MDPKPYVVWFLGPPGYQITQYQLAECWYEDGKNIVKALNEGREVHMKRQETGQAIQSHERLDAFSL